MMNKKSKWLSLVIFVEVVALQAITAVFSHYSPYERVMNFKALFLGAQTAPLFWGVAFCDVVAWSAFGWLLYLSLPRPNGKNGGVVRFFAMYLLATALVIPFHLSAIALGNHLLAFGQLPGLLLQTFLAALLAAAGILLVPAAALTESWKDTWALWARRLLRSLWRVLLLGALLWFANQVAFFLIVVPLLGVILRPLVYVALVWWLFSMSAHWLKDRGLRENSVRPTVSWQAPMVLASVLAFVVVLVIVLPGPQPHSDAVVIPPLVTKSTTIAPSRVHITNQGAEFSSGQVTLNVQKAPFDFSVLNRNGKVILRLSNSSRGRHLSYHGVALSTELRTVRMIPLLWTGNTIKSRWTLGASALDRAEEISQDGDSLVVRGHAGKLPVDIRFAFVAQDTLKISVHFDDANRWAVSSLSFESSPGEHFLGFGERVNHIDQHGEDVYNLVEENGYGPGFLTPLVRRWLGDRWAFPNGELCTYWPVPFYLSSKGYGLFLAESYDPRIEADSAYPDIVRVSSRGNHLETYIFAGDNLISDIGSYTDITGKPRKPPTWVFLPWKSRSGGPTEPLIREDMEKMRELHIPTSALNVEAWEKWAGSFIVDRTRYPRIENLVSQAHQEGYKMSFWMFPYVQANADNPVYREGVRKGYFVENRVGLPYHFITFFGTEVVIDMTNPNAVAWFQKHVETMYKIGFDAHMNDFGESIPPDSVFYNGKSGFEMRNLYPLLYIQAVDAAAHAVKGDDYVIYPRSGFTGIQRFIALQWPGDQNTDWSQSDGLPTAVRAMINVSMAGVPVHGSDIGGWHDIVCPPTDKELFLRWAELGAYSPWMRAHGGFRHPVREPWRFDQETVDIYRDLADMHTKLFPYLYSWAIKASQTGEPIVRHPSLLWPDDEVWYKVEDEYLLGDALLVAPVVSQGVNSRQVRFPPGKWRHLKRGQVYDQGVYRVSAPIGDPPVFLRQGKLLPMFTEAFDTLEPSSDPDVRVGSLQSDLTVYWFVGSHDHMKLFDGSILDVVSDSKGVRLTFNGVHSRRITWVLYGTDKPKEILLDGKTLNQGAWLFDRQSRTLTISLPRIIAGEVLVQE